MLLLPESRVCYAGDLLFIGIAPVMWRLGESPHRNIEQFEEKNTVSLRAGPASAWVKALDDLLEVQSLQSVKFARCILYKFLFEDASRKCRVNK